MQKIAFVDIEASKNSHILHSVGLIIGDYCLEEKHSLDRIKQEIIERKVEYICGHNFIDYDNKILKEKGFDVLSHRIKIIDTFYLSLLLNKEFREHNLKKEYKDGKEIFNDPVKDCEETQKLFEFLEKRFDKLNGDLKQIFIYLLKDNEYFQGFFHYKNYIQESNFDICQKISQFTEAPKNLIEFYVEKSRNEKNFCIELAFALSYAGIKDKFAQALPSAILRKFPKITKDRIIQNLSFNLKSVDIGNFAKNEFGIENFRKFDSVNTQSEKKISQEDIIKAALEDKSLLVILPTEGGKTFTFQLPALLKAKAYKGLSIVISPLQALMKDHTESFETKTKNIGNFTILALSGYLNYSQKEIAREKILVAKLIYCISHQKL